MANASIYNAFERMWQHTSTAADSAKKYANEKAVEMVNRAKRYTDGHYDIMSGSDTCKRTVLFNEDSEYYVKEEDYSGFYKIHSESGDIGEDLAGAIVEALLTPILLSDAVLTSEDFANGATLVVESDAPNSKRFTYEFTSDDVVPCINGSYTYYKFTYDKSATGIRADLAFIPEELIGIDLEESEDIMVYTKAGIHMLPVALFQLPFLDDDGNYEATLEEGATYVSVTLTINGFSGFTTSKTLKPEHLTEHNHNDLYHTKDVTNAKVSGVKNYVDGMYDITYGDTLNIAATPAYGELKFVGEHTNGVNIIPTETTTAISNNVITADEFTDWSISIFSIANPNIEPVVIAPGVTVNNSLFSLSDGGITEHTISDTVIEDATYSGLLKVSDIFYVIPEEAVGVNLAGSPLFPEISSDWDGEYMVTEVTASIAGLYCFNLIWYLIAYAQGNGITDGNIGCTLTIQNYTGFPTTQTLKPVHLPDSVSSKSYVSDSISTAIEAAIGGSY